MGVKGEATVYIAAQCPPLGGGPSENSTHTKQGVHKALGAELGDWPDNELPIATAGFHPAWKGKSGFGEFRLVDGYRISVDANHIDMPIYKIVLDTPAEGSDGFVDVVVQWNFKTWAEATVVIVRKGHIHCKEEEWPLAEFNDEVRHLLPFKEESGRYLCRGIVCLLFSCVFSTAVRYSSMGERQMWWLETMIVLVISFPTMMAVYRLPINLKKETLQALTTVSLNRPRKGELLDPPVSQTSAQILIESGRNKVAQFQRHLGSSRDYDDDHYDVNSGGAAIADDYYTATGSGSYSGSRSHASSSIPGD